MAVLCAACSVQGDADEDRAGRSSRAPDPSRVVARVDGEAILVDDVASLLEDARGRDKERVPEKVADAGAGDGGTSGPEDVLRHWPSANEALEDLVRLELLAGEARRRGFGSFAEVEDARRAALARALLVQRIDRGVNARTLDEKKLRSIYEAGISSFVHGPLRRVAHMVVLAGKNGLPDAQAKKEAERIAAAARSVATLEGFRELGNRESSGTGGKIKYEELPPFPADSTAFVQPFVKATFAIGGSGQSGGPVSTRYGWHVIFVIEELPAENRSFGEVRAQLVEGLLPVEKRAAAESLMDRLSKAGGIFIYESALLGAGEAP
ncbi:MAG: peptidyl-prolyl cis-trans isomerase [Deltaproteobacteria bacterium]|nr:peptidyl-prolyl cis-trans isomerase [Deltaproteobacteria bacterium]